MRAAKRQRASCGLTIPPIYGMINTFTEESKMSEQIREKLEELRGMLQADGGDMDVVAIEGKTVKLRLRGACGSCPHATMTLKQGIERILRESIDPEIVVERV